MDQLLYVLSLGFSGSDAVRALILLLVGALFVGKRILPLKMTVILLVIDLVWPYAAAAFEPGGAASAPSMIQGQAMHWQDGLAAFLVRAAGFYIFIRGSYSLRRKLHQDAADGSGKLLPF
ncbi:hypothetical protein [Parvularcula maris]|uniref:Uncharacterized protein n=1 Tax=Parvularcula maris TaxID=2965077 RepID=A0A9X2LA27_9PROT|nr:hypothetical protein [Parvularcula maris]MCQ8185900.1 hypothetical protein [Parvularcula maris]